MEKIKTTNRQTRAIQTKYKLYEAADKLFKKYGFENVSVDAIVEEAGVSKGAFYVHYSSKDILVTALINDYVNQVDLDYKSYIETLGVDIPASEIIILLIKKVVNIIENTIGHDNMNCLYKAQLAKTVNTDTVWGYNRELYTMFTNVLNRGLQQGELRTDISIDTLARHCIMAIRGLTYEWCIRYPDFNLVEQAEEHFEILLDGIIRK